MTSAVSPKTHTRDSARGAAATVSWIDRGLFAALLLACALATSKNLADPDLWGHVQYGKDLLAEGLPRYTTYSYTTADYPWINHENLSEVAFAVGIQWLGTGGMLTLKMLLALGVFLLLIGRAQRAGAGLVAIYFTMLLAAANLMHFWSLRPQLFTYGFFFLLLLLLERAWPWPGAPRETAHTRPRPGFQPLWLLALPPLLAVWANTHGGFVAGLATAVVFLGGRLLEHPVLAQSLTQQPHTQQPGGDGVGAALGQRVAWVGGILAACLAATLINPYGWRLHGWLLKSLGEPRPEIIEWLPPELLHVAWLPYWLMVAALAAAVAGTRRPRDWVAVAILALLLWQACSHRRHIAFLALAFAYWMPPHVDSLFRRLGIGTTADSISESYSPRARYVFGAAILGVCLLFSAALASQLRRVPVRRDGYPVTAFQFMADQQLRGKLAVQFKWAQYAIAAFAPTGEMQVAFDGRFRTCYPQEIVDMYFDFAAGEQIRRHRGDPAPADPARLLEYKTPDLVLIDRKQRHAAAVMKGAADQWVLLYQDGLAQLWGRRTVYDDPTHRDYLPPPRRSVSDAPQEGVCHWPALPIRNRLPSRVALSTD